MFQAMDRNHQGVISFKEMSDSLEIAQVWCSAVTIDRHNEPPLTYALFFVYTISLPSLLSVQMDVNDQVAIHEAMEQLRIDGLFTESDWCCPKACVPR